jgi:tRNA splicing endonuclease
MNLVDSIQHLGIVHLFQEQIEDALMSIHESEFRSSSLYEVALRFRLLREHGFWVPPGIQLHTSIYEYGTDKFVPNKNRY